MTKYTYDDATVSDLHKDAYGFRPSEDFHNMWAISTPKQKQDVWDSLIVVLNREMIEESNREDEAIAQFEAVITSYMECGKCDRTTAIRWMQDVHETFDKDRDDVEYFEYLLGIPYGYIAKTTKDNYAKV